MDIENNETYFLKESCTTRVCNGIETAMHAFKLLIDSRIIKDIVSCVNEFAQESRPNWSTNEEEVERFIGLLFL